MNQPYARFGCKFCPKRFTRIRERSDHAEQKHGYKSKPLHTGDYGSHFTPAVRILQAIARRQKLVLDPNGRPQIVGPLASHLADFFDVTDRAMRKRMTTLEQDGLVTYNRWNGCVVTARGFRYIDEHRGRK